MVHHDPTFKCCGGVIERFDAIGLVQVLSCLDFGAELFSFPGLVLALISKHFCEVVHAC